MKKINYFYIVISILLVLIPLICFSICSTIVNKELVSKYDKSYKGHKMLAEIYEKEGGMRKTIDEYVKMLDIKGDDYDEML